MLNRSTQRCNVYFFDSVGFLSQVSPMFLQVVDLLGVSPMFLQVVDLLGGPEIPRKPVLAMLGWWNW